MSFKIGFLIIPMALASFVTVPAVDGVYLPNKIDLSLSITPDPGISYSSSTPFISTSTTNEDYFYCDKYGPFSLTNTKDFPATFEYELNSISNQSIIERIRVFNSNNSVVASSSKAPFSYIRGTRRSVTFTVPFKDYWSASGLTLKFEIVNSSSAAILKAYSATFYPPSKKTVYGPLIKREIYTSKSLGFYSENNQMKEMKETFDFTVLGDYLGVDYYYRLNLLNNYFLYPHNYLLTYYGVSLRFNDDDNLFPYYSHQDNGDVVIPLSLYKSGDTVRFKYLNTFYINKRTLQLSDTYRTGFVSTRDFYLPVNGKRLFNNKQLYIDIDRLGMDQISTSIPIKYDITRSLAGVCTDGEYCVIGGNR